MEGYPYAETHRFIMKILCQGGGGLNKYLVFVDASLAAVAVNARSEGHFQDFWRAG
jgi:hypothetical protein